MRSMTAAWQRFREAARAPQEPENMRTIAGSLWHALLLCAAASAILSIVYGVSQFNTTSNALSIERTSNAPAQTNADRATLAGDLRILAARASRYQELKTQPLSVPDPSK